MIDYNRLIHFVKPYYEKKDIMHDLTHIDKMIRSANQLLKFYPEITDHDLIKYACYFHGFIYLDEERIRSFCTDRLR